MSRKDISKKYDISPVTLKKILRNQDAILNKIKRVKENFRDMKSMKTLSKVWESPFEKSLYMWFVQKRNLNQPVPTILLQDKAKQFHRHFYGETNFTTSDGWLQKFKKRHRLRTLSAKGE